MSFNPVHRATRRIVFGVSVVAVAATIVACATAGTTKTQLHEMNVMVQNNLQTATPLTIYAVNSIESRELGKVGANDTALVTFVPPRKRGGSYRLIAERPNDRPIRSQPFAVGADVGTITWTLVPNILSFDQAGIIDTINVDSASAR